MNKGPFAVVCKETHRGAFNGVPETLHASLEDWVDRRVAQHVPGVLLDHRTTMETKVTFLRGLGVRFWVAWATNGARRDWCDAPPNGIFTSEGGNFIEDFMTGQHSGRLYPILTTFAAIKLPVGPRILVFNPACPLRLLVIDEGASPAARDDAHVLMVRAPVAGDAIDMEECEPNFTDLSLECLTRAQFEAKCACAAPLLTPQVY